MKCSEIVEKDNFIYRFSLKDLQQLKVKHFIKQRLINYFEKKQLKIKNFHQLNEILVFLLPDIKKKERLFVTEIIHKKLCKVHDKEGIDILFDLDLSKMIFKKELSKILEQLLCTKKIVYWAESSIQYNKPSVKGWHTDDPINELNNNFGKHFKLELLYIFILQNYILEELNFCQSHIKIRILDFFKGLLRKKYKLLHLKNINFCLSKISIRNQMI